MAQSRRAVMPRVPVQGAGHVDVEGVQVRRRGELDGAAAAGAAPALGRLGPRCPTPPASQRSPRGAAPEHPRCRQQMRQQQMRGEMLARTGSGRRGAGAGRLADAGVVGGSRDEGRRTVSVGGGGARRGVRAGRGVLDGGGRGRPPRGTRLPGPW